MLPQRICIIGGILAHISIFDAGVARAMLNLSGQPKNLFKNFVFEISRGLSVDSQ
jgi:hypothetical protein